MAANERRFQNYDLFKLAVTIGLVILLLVLIWRRPPATVPATGGTPTTAAPAGSPSPTPVPAAPTSLTVPTLRAEVAGGQLQLSGSAAPGAALQILIDGQPAGTATAGADGGWTFARVAAPGDRTIVVNALDAAGQVAAASAPLAITVPAPIVEPTFEVEVRAGGLEISGTGTPGSTVQIVIDGRVAGTATVGAGGQWSYTAEIASGEHTVAVDALDAAGQVAASAPELRIAGPAPARAPALDRPAGPLTAGSLTLAGTGAPGSTVQIVIDGQPAGTATVGTDGRWSFDTTLAAGQRRIVVNALDAAGQVAASGEVATLTVAALSPPAVTPAPGTTNACRPGDPDAFGVDQGQTWLVERCDTLAHIARQTGIDLNALIAANPQVADPDLIFPGQLITLPGR
jgi:hypothetical protein